MFLQYFHILILVKGFLFIFTEYQLDHFKPIHFLSLSLFIYIYIHIYIYTYIYITLVCISLEKAQLKHACISMYPFFFFLFSYIYIHIYIYIYIYRRMWFLPSDVCSLSARRSYGLRGSIYVWFVLVWFTRRRFLYNHLLPQ